VRPFSAVTKQLLGVGGGAARLGGFPAAVVASADAAGKLVGMVEERTMERARRVILAVMPGVVSVLIAATTPAQQPGAAGPPRKIVVGSLMYSMWGPYPGLAKRLEALSSFIDAMARMARQKCHAGLDIAALPETAVNGEVKGSAKDVALPLEGAVLETLGAAARRNKTYVVVPLYLAEDVAKTRLSNACVLLDRRGKAAGIYRKVYPVDSGKAGRLEGGVLPGKEFPVFACDFGKDGGIFWSNDPQIPVMEMVRGLGLELPADSLDRNRRLQDRLRGGPPSGE
jgi:hypothetical protein